MLDRVYMIKFKQMKSPVTKMEGTDLMSDDDRRFLLGIVISIVKELVFKFLFD